MFCFDFKVMLVIQRVMEDGRESKRENIICVEKRSCRRKLEKRRGDEYKMIAVKKIYEESKGEGKEREYIPSFPMC